MKYLLVLLAVCLFSKLSYSQSDTVALNTPAIFSITFHEDKNYLIFPRGNTTYNEVYLDKLTQDYLVLRKKYHDEKNPDAISKYAKIPLKDIKSLGYATGTQETFGGLIGMGIGAVGGTFIALIAKGWDKGEGKGKFNPGATESIGTQIIGWTAAGAILGYIIGGHSNEYKKFDLSKLSNEKKFEEINEIVKKGMSSSKKK